MIISETRIDKHHCLVLDPPVIPPATPVVVTLHGMGTNADDLAPFCEQLNLPHCRFVLPDAPFHLPGYPDGAYAWYDFRPALRSPAEAQGLAAPAPEKALVQAHDRKQIEKSRDYLFKVLDRFADDPNLRPAVGGEKKPRPLVLMGFSQGGVMSLEAGLNYKGKISAIVSMSGYMPDPWATLTKAQAPFETPILLVHGTQDQIVPVEGSRQAAEALKQAGYQPVLKEFPMPHMITQESMEEVSKFLRQTLALNR